MKILLIEPFYSGSHKDWADQLQKFSQHDVSLLTMPGFHWKWRMRGGAISMAKQYRSLTFKPDLIFASDMLDLATFKALSGVGDQVKCLVYFHENQITYPHQDNDEDAKLRQDFHYALTNITSALAADAIAFNSKYHYTVFLNSINGFLKRFPDFNETEIVDQLRPKSRVLPLGLDLKRFDAYIDRFKHVKQNIGGLSQINKDSKEQLTFLWNHRWEYDKNPKEYFDVLSKLKDQQIDFDLQLIGQSFKKTQDDFVAAKIKFEKEIKAFGRVDSFSEYARTLCSANIMHVTSNQEFFGVSVVEAIYCGVFVLAPNRLSYPELIIEENIYKNEADLIQKIKSFTKKNTKESNIQKSIQKIIKYDWSNIISQYDDFFDSLITAC